MASKHTSPVHPLSKFYVTNWRTGAIIETCDTLPEAKKVAKAQGAYNGAGLWKGAQPVAYVAADCCDLDHWQGTTPVWSRDNTTRCCVYSPRFKEATE